MNLYFLVEGDTERLVYPMWIRNLVPNLIEVESSYDIGENNFYIITGGGYPGLITHMIEPSIEEINEVGNFDYFVIVLDADELTVEERVEEVRSFVYEKGLTLYNTKMMVITQNRCFETWCLGNRRFFTRYPDTKEFTDCVNFYDVNQHDPELMTRDLSKKKYSTIAQYHSYYLKKMAIERGGTYSKGNSDFVGTKGFLEGIMNRTETTSHLKSFVTFLDLMREIREKVVPV